MFSGKDSEEFDFYNRGRGCLQRGTDWPYVTQIRFVFKWLK